MNAKKVIFESSLQLNQIIHLVIYNPWRFHDKHSEVASISAFRATITKDKVLIYSCFVVIKQLPLGSLNQIL